MHRSQRRLSPSLVVAAIALFVALSGTAIGGISKVIVKKPEQLAGEVVTAAKLADDAVTNRAVSDNSVGFEELTAPVVSAGVNKGIDGGDPFFINPTDENVSVEVDDAEENVFHVTFDRPVRHCQWTVTHATGVGVDIRKASFFDAQPSTLDQKAVLVTTQALRSFGAELRVVNEPASFYLTGRC
jgi:hypothetical protein